MKKEMGQASLQNLIDSTPKIVEYFRNDTLAPHAKHRAHLTPIPVDESNWIDEQRAWRNTAILFNQSFHMPELSVRGPDSFKLLNYVGVTSFEGFVPGRAKSFLGCAPNGKVIGECILHQHGPEDFELISGQYLLNWVQYVAESGGYNVVIQRDNAIWDHPTGKRNNFRFQIDGPNAAAIFDDIVDGETPHIPFFRTARVKIGGKHCFVLRHAMSGHAGVEISGDFAHHDYIKNYILQVGKKHGILPAGTRTYFSSIVEGGWMPYPLPAIYTGEEMRGYRDWLSLEHAWESRAQIGGSFISDNIEDYYVTPWDLGLHRVVKFDHDFIGREALEKIAAGPKRKKVTLLWNKDDVARIHASRYERDELPFKYLDYPSHYYSFQQADQIKATDGRIIGIAQYSGYTANEAATLSHAYVNEEDAAFGTEAILTWGEPDGGTRKPHVERHRQTDVRVTISPSPFPQTVQDKIRAAI